MGVLIEGPAGLLEVALDWPVDTPRGLAVICHPHSLHGGSLNNKVVTSLAKGFQAAGLATLRFNFRGVGQSSGAYDAGEGEQADLQAAVAYARAQAPELPLHLAGFSFGAYVALRSLPALEVDGVTLVAPPVDLYDFSALSVTHRPWSLILAGEDEVVSTQGILEWHAALPHQAHVYWREGASHFFHGQLLWLRQVARLIAEVG
jgi:alpha/beta superfamily hydrolase